MARMRRAGHPRRSTTRTDSCASSQRRGPAAHICARVVVATGDGPLSNGRHRPAHPRTASLVHLPAPRTLDTDHATADDVVGASPCTSVGGALVGAEAEPRRQVCPSPSSPVSPHVLGSFCISPADSSLSHAAPRSRAQRRRPCTLYWLRIHLPVHTTPPSTSPRRYPAPTSTGMPRGQHPSPAPSSFILIQVT